MTGLLQRAIAAMEKLPAEEQDAVATRIMAELADEQARAKAPGTVLHEAAREGKVFNAST